MIININVGVLTEIYQTESNPELSGDTEILTSCAMTQKENSSNMKLLTASLDRLQ